jgi:hypothetical protein
VSKFNAYFVQRQFSVGDKTAVAFRAVIPKQRHSSMEYQESSDPVPSSSPRVCQCFWRSSIERHSNNFRMHYSDLTVTSFVIFFSSKIQSMEATNQASQTLWLRVSFWRKCHAHSRNANDSYVVHCRKSCCGSCLIVIRKGLWSAGW